MKRTSVRTFMFLQILTKSRHGTIDLTLPDGRKEKFGEGAPVITVEVKQWHVIDMLFSKGDLGLAEAIIEGELIVDDAAALIEWACRNDQDLCNAIYGSWYGNLVQKIYHFLNRGDKKRARKNIIAHYDLGNEFYRLWLDPSMTYSSAIFNSPSQPLHEAQQAKYDRIIDSLNIKSGDHVLEIGCGWGGFFSRAVERTGCKVTAVLNSPEQARHNRSMINASGFNGHVDLLEQDYREIDGKYDKVVSIEMIEAVGEKYWDTYFRKLSSSLKNGGEALVQGITIRDDLFYSYRKGTDFIQQYVFPGGMLPTPNIIDAKSNSNSMMVGDSYFFGLHYADTLKTWRENFEKALPQVKEMGFDEKFIRMWSLYFSYCEGAFRSSRINVGQFLMTKTA